MLHHVIPWHKELFYADDQYNLSFSIDRRIEAEANQLAAHLMFGVDRFTQESLDYKLSLAVPKSLADKYDASYHAAFRRYVEAHQLPCALLIFKLEKSDLEFISINEAHLDYQYMIKSQKFIEEYDLSTHEIVKLVNQKIKDLKVRNLLNNTESLDGVLEVNETAKNRIVELNYQSWGNFYNLFVLVFPNIKQTSKRIIEFT